MNLLKKIDHYLLTNHPILWRTKVHYFVLFSLVLGNVVAYFSRQLLGIESPTSFKALGMCFLISMFVVSIWMLSQTRIKIKNYRFWDEVLTLGSYIFSAILLYINWCVFWDVPFIDLNFRRNDYSFIGNPSVALLFLFVFVFAVSVYVAAHSSFKVGLGLILLHIVILPFAAISGGGVYALTVLVALPFGLVPGNEALQKFFRFFVILSIPLGILMLTTAHFLKFNWSSVYWYPIFFIVVAATILGGAALVKQNFKRY